MTEIAAIEASRRCSLPLLTDLSKLHDSYTNVKYGTCYLKLMYEVSGRDWIRTLILYNGGYLQLRKFDKGEMMAAETSDYVIRVQEALGICRGMNEDKLTIDTGRQ